MFYTNIQENIHCQKIAASKNNWQNIQSQYDFSTNNYDKNQGYMYDVETLCQ